jgi:hypothetical protein
MFNYLKSCDFRNLFFDMASVVKVPKDYNTSVIIKNSSVTNVNNCGSFLSNIEDNEESNDMESKTDSVVDSAIYFNGLKMLEFSRKEYLQRFNPPTNLTGVNISIAL